MYIAHVFLFPALIALLITVHLVLVASRHHTQFRRARRATERKLLGVPMFPGQAPRSLGLLLGVAALLFLLGGLVQINPIWLWGPYHVADATNGAQPDWYLGWLIGALRLVPAFDVTIGGYTVVPNPFWGGALFPLLVLVVLMAWPWLERRVTRDHGYHNVLDRPRDAPGRTAFGAAFLVWVFLVFLAGSADRVYLFLNWSYATQIWIYRALVIFLPIIVFLITRRVCRELQRIEAVELTRTRELAGSRVAGADALSRTSG
jgi:ubiquinol-cytochrome c reductase cytochrome b subunit